MILDCLIDLSNLTKSTVKKRGKKKKKKEEKRSYYVCVSNRKGKILMDCEKLCVCACMYNDDLRKVFERSVCSVQR